MKKKRPTFRGTFTFLENEILPDGSMRYEDFIILIKRKSPLLFEYKLFKIQYKIQYYKEKVGYILVLILVLLYVYIVQNVTDFFFTVLGFVLYFK